MQLVPENRSTLHKNISKRVRAADSEIKSIMESGTMTEQQKTNLQYLKKRRNNLVISLLLVYDTDRIMNDRRGKIKGLKEVLATDDVEHNLRVHNEIELKELKKAENCTRPRCFKRGWTGFRSLTGEFELCTCTVNTIHHYIK